MIGEVGIPAIHILFKLAAASNGLAHLHLLQKIFFEMNIADVQTAAANGRLVERTN